MRVWCYSFTWNESALVPFFLRHYSSAWVERIVVYDNLSTDRTPDLLRQDSRVEVRPFDTGGAFDEAALTDLRDDCWKEARGRADWCVLVDFDEFLWHKDGAPAYLSGLSESVAVVRGRGRQMIASAFPVDDGRTPLTDLVRTGTTHAPLYSKPCLLRPDRVGELHAGQGLHDARPVGFDGKPFGVDVEGPLLLHYRLLGPAYHAAKNAAQMRRPYRDDVRERNRLAAGMLRDVLRSTAGVEIDEATASDLFKRLPPMPKETLHWHPDGTGRPLGDQDRELFARLWIDAVDVLA